MSKDEKTGEHWWPKPLAHVRDIDPGPMPMSWSPKYRASMTRASYRASSHVLRLVPVAELAEAKKNLVSFEYGVEASGPRPWPSPDHPYTPKFWIGREGSPRCTYEPLVLSWKSHDKTVLQPIALRHEASATEKRGGMTRRAPSTTSRASPLRPSGNFHRERPRVSPLKGIICRIISPCARRH